MFPLGHAAVAYLCYVGVAAATRRPLPVHWGLVPLAVGSQFPDLVDKPLAYYGVLVSGRSLGHSIVTAVVLAVTVRWAVQRVPAPDRPELGRLREVSPPAFAVGYLSHLAADAVEPLRAGALKEAGFLLWPVVAPIDYPQGDLSPITRMLAVHRQLAGHPQIELILLAAAVFVGLEVRYRAGDRTDDR